MSNGKITSRFPIVLPAPPVQPPGSAYGGEIVLTGDLNLSTKSAQPSIQDVLNAMQDLSKKLSQLSKNQQVLANKFDLIDKIVRANYTNIITAANYGISWQNSLFEVSEYGMNAVGPNPPHYAKL